MTFKSLWSNTISWILIAALLGSYFSFIGINQVQAEIAIVDAVEDQLIVKFKDGVDGANVIAARKGRVLEYIAEMNLYKISLPSSSSLQKQLSAYNADRRVQFAEPNYIGEIANTYPNDPQYGSQYHISNMNVDDVWNDAQSGTKGSSDVVIAVIDTGVDSDHPDLVDKLLPGINTTTDGSGANDTNDTQGHGTHVAGIAAGATNNGIGTAGVCPDCKILPIRAMLSNGGGTHFDVVEGINWVTEWAQANPSKKVIINMSLGFTTKVASLELALNNAYKAGILSFASAGNDGKAVLRYPAAYPNVIGIGSTTSDNLKSSFSNMGSFVDLSAPGTGILATVIEQNGYNYKQGTSMAAPNAAGVAALVWSKRNTLTNYELEWLLKASARKGTAQTVKDNNFGHGIVDAYAAITASGDKFNSSITGSTLSLANLSTTTVFSFNATAAGYVTAKVFDSQGRLIRTIVEDKAIKAGVQRNSWDAKNDGKTFVESGSYQLVVGVKYENGNSAMEVKQLTVDRSVSVTNAQVSNATLDLTNGGPASTSLTFSAGEAIAGVVAILDQNNKVVKALTPSFNLANGANSTTYTWDGKNNAKVPAYVADGDYKFAIIATDTLKNKGTISVNVRVKGRAPTIEKGYKTDIFTVKIGKIGGSIKLPFVLSEPAKTATVVIKNSSGATVFSRTYSEGTGLPAGVNLAPWDGWSPSPTPGYVMRATGNFTIEVTITDLDDNPSVKWVGSIKLN